MEVRRIGPFEVYPVGLGAMPLSMGKDERPNERQAIATVHAALDAGVTFIDTADVYAPSWDAIGHNERIVARALASYSGSTDPIIVGTKGGITRGPGDTWGRNGSMPYLRSAVEASLRSLDRDVIDLYQWHRPDRSLVYGEVVSQLATLRDEGKIRAIGISNANIEEIDIAIEVLGPGGLASVQNEFSPRFTCSRAELEHCNGRGVAFLPWSPLGGIGKGPKELGEKYKIFMEVGLDIGVSPYQAVLAWELSLRDNVIPIPGASRPETIIDSAKAARLTLDPEHLRGIEASLS
jgi:aryl-alcohol dehydrogenase-like predicted oxidoreductase